MALTNGDKFTSEELSKRTELNGEFGDNIYYRVNVESLPEFYNAFKNTLNSNGLERWNARYDCNNLTTLYVAVAKARFAAKNLKIETDKQETIAIAEIWYIRSVSNKGHAIAAMYTNVGLIYIEPETGERIYLTDKEKKSIFFCKW